MNQSFYIFLTNLCSFNRTKEDGEEYEKRVEVMVEQANKIEIHGQKVQGK